MQSSFSKLAFLLAEEKSLMIDAGFQSNPIMDPYGGFADLDGREKGFPLRIYNQIFASMVYVPTPSNFSLNFFTARRYIILFGLSGGMLVTPGTKLGEGYWEWRVVGVQSYEISLKENALIVKGEWQVDVLEDCPPLPTTPN
jgi:hypothetical protein